MRWLALVTIVACSSGTAVVDTPKRQDERRTRVERGLLPGVRVVGEDAGFSIEERMREHRIPAVGVAVFHDYELQWVKTYGLADVERNIPATEDTRFLAGSISKSVNALGQLLAVADGVMALDQPIKDYLTSWKLPDNPLTTAKPVTLRMLLSHTAGTTVHGFRGYFDHEPVPTTIQTLDGTPPANHPAIRVDLAPGSRFRYSGGGTTISQLALSDRLKQPYAKLMADRVLGPLGMTHSSYDQTSPARTQLAAMGYGEHGKPVEGGRIHAPEMAAAGLWTTAGDLAKFFLEIAKARAGKSKLISKTVAEQMTTRIAPVSESSPDAVGLGVFLMEKHGTIWFGHGGAHIGFQCDAIASLDGGNGVVIMASSENGRKIFGEIQRAVFAEYGWPGIAPPIARVAIPPADRDRFVGRYLLDGMPMQIVVQGDKLTSGPPFGDPSELVPVGPDRVVDRSDGTEMKIRPDGSLELPAKGKVVIAPRGDHFLWPLLDGKFDDAVALLKASPKARADEDLVNSFGYRLLGTDPKRAIEMLRLNATAFPDSSNAHDSLAEAYAKSGDTANAIAEYERALATLDADPRIDAATKPAVRKRTDEALTKLRR